MTPWMMIRKVFRSRVVQGTPALSLYLVYDSSEAATSCVIVDNSNVLAGMR